MSASITQRLPWRVMVEGRVVAQFADERDARGFAQARFRSAGSVCRSGSVAEAVWHAVQAGATTSREVATRLELRPSMASAYLSQLARRGYVQVVGQTGTRLHYGLGARQYRERVS